jgi:hypothetical protein
MVIMAQGFYHFEDSHNRKIHTLMKVKNKNKMGRKGSQESNRDRIMKNRKKTTDPKRAVCRKVKQKRE